MKISGQFGIENYPWKVDIIEESLWILLIFLFAFFYAKMPRNLQRKMRQYAQAKMRQLFL